MEKLLISSSFGIGLLSTVQADQLPFMKEGALSRSPSQRTIRQVFLKESAQYSQIFGYNTNNNQLFIN